jgi:hypothetical protein
MASLRSGPPWSSARPAAGDELAPEEMRRGTPAMGDDSGFMYDPEPTLPERMERAGVTKDGELD